VRNLTGTVHATDPYLAFEPMYHTQHPYSGTQKSVWEQYNDMAIRVDSLRETRWTGLADTILVFVNAPYSGYSIVLTFFGSLVACCSYHYFPHFHHPSTPTEQHRYLKRHSAPYIFSAQQYLRSRICHPTVFRLFKYSSRQLSPLCEFYSCPTLTLIWQCRSKGWLRDFDRSWRPSDIPEERARAREMSLCGLERWQLPQLITLLPFLIQLSLILFFIALLIMFFHLHRPTAYPTLGILAVGISLYLFATIISVLDTSAPFTSFVSRVLSRRKFRVQGSSESTRVDKERPVHESTGDE
jgi:hypothetical protein